MSDKPYNKLNVIEMSPLAKKLREIFWSGRENQPCAVTIDIASDYERMAEYIEGNYTKKENGHE